MRSAIGLKKKYPGEVVLSGDRFAVDFAADMADNESAVSGVFLVTDKEGNNVTSTLTDGNVDCEGTVVGKKFVNGTPGETYDVFVTATSDLNGVYQEYFRVLILDPIVAIP